MSTPGGESESAHLGVSSRKERWSGKREEEDIEEAGEGEDDVREDGRAEGNVSTAEGSEADDGNGEDGDRVDERITKAPRGNMIFRT